MQVIFVLDNGKQYYTDFKVDDRSISNDNTYMDPLNNDVAEQVIPDHEYYQNLNDKNSSAADEFPDYELDNYEISNSNYNGNIEDDINVHDSKLKVLDMYREKGKISSELRFTLLN